MFGRPARGWRREGFDVRLTRETFTRDSNGPAGTLTGWPTCPSANGHSHSMLHSAVAASAYARYSHLYYVGPKTLAGSHCQRSLMHLIPGPKSGSRDRDAVCAPETLFSFLKTGPESAYGNSSSYGCSYFVLFASVLPTGTLLTVKGLRRWIHLYSYFHSFIFSLEAATFIFWTGKNEYENRHEWRWNIKDTVSKVVRVLLSQTSLLRQDNFIFRKID